jgi:hypothetical protein
VPAPLLVTLTSDDLRALVAEAVAEALADRPPEAATPALLTQRQLAKTLNVSERSVYSFRSEGMPHLMIGESPRFALVECLAWFRTRQDKNSPRSDI